MTLKLGSCEVKLVCREWMCSVHACVRACVVQWVSMRESIPRDVKVCSVYGMLVLCIGCVWCVEHAWQQRLLACNMKVSKGGKLYLTSVLSACEIGP